MPDLFVANASMYEHDFTYKLPETTRESLHRIGAGKQIKLTMNQDEIDVVIARHEPYGFTEASKVGKGFGGLCYRIGKPISVSAIEQGIDQVQQDAIDRALEARKINAVSTDQEMAKVTQEMGGKQIGSYEIEISEDNKGPTENADRFEQTVSVQKEDVQPLKRGRPRKE